MIQPLISIVIPCYNGGKTIGQTLDSLRAQTYAPLEIVVVDDGSTDPDTIAFLNAQTDIRLVRQLNRGLPAARNAGFRAAAGSYVLPLDADDWLEPDTVDKLMAALLGTEGAHYAYCHLRLEGEARGSLKKSYNYFEQLFFNQMPYCLLMPKVLWAELGGYDESMRQGYEDWDFNIRLGGAGCFGVVVPEALFHYRVSSGGMLLSTSTRLHGKLWAFIQRKNPALYRPLALLRAWSFWRQRPSTYPLWLYFGWFFLHKALPAEAFQALFRRIMRRSHARRVTQQARG